MNGKKESLDAMWDPELYHVNRGGRSTGIFVKHLPAAVDVELLATLKQTMFFHNYRSIRLCLHDTPEALFHTMIIVEESGNYCRPHRHQDKGECFHILEGKLGIISFDNEGIVIDNVTLEAGATLMYQIATNMYHSVIPLTPSVIYHESKLGPFRKENDSLFALYVGKVPA